MPILAERVLFRASPRHRQLQQRRLLFSTTAWSHKEVSVTVPSSHGETASSSTAPDQPLTSPPPIRGRLRFTYRPTITTPEGTPWDAVLTPVHRSQIHEARWNPLAGAILARATKVRRDRRFNFNVTPGTVGFLKPIVRSNLCRRLRRCFKLALEEVGVDADGRSTAVPATTPTKPSAGTDKQVLAGDLLIHADRHVLHATEEQLIELCLRVVRAIGGSSQLKQRPASSRRR